MTTDRAAAQPAPAAGGRTRVVVTGATGNLGSALLRAVAASAPHWDVVGLARRLPDRSAAPYDRAEWVALDLGDPGVGQRLTEVLAGADAVVHFAWALQPSRDPAPMTRTNLDGSRHLFDAVQAAGVPHLVHTSSVGAYSPMRGAAHKPRMREDWPTGGIRTSLYSRQKVAVERMLDDLERAADAPVVTRLRPGLVLQGEAASSLSRYFLGALAPVAALAPRLPVLPLPGGLLGSALHSDDLADAVLRVVERRAGGAFNLAAEPPLDSATVARALGARRVPVPFSLARAVTGATWWLRIQPTDVGWLDIARSCPLMDTTRAREVLDWQPRRSPVEALEEVGAGLRSGAGAPTPVLAARGRE